MPSHMSVQKIAIKRNAFAEMLIDYILQRFSKVFYQKGYITELVDPEQQKAFLRDDCSEVYDHYMELPLSSKLDKQCRTLEIWAQTTCYKGNSTGKPESNKTYEIRETLTEALTLRRWLTEEGKFFRTMHFTLGPSNYTYGWFIPAKKNAFDLSLYPKFSSDEDLFDVIADIGKGTIFEFDFYKKLDQIMEDKKHPLTIFISQTINSIEKYFINGFASSGMANRQASLLHGIRMNEASKLEDYVSASHMSGMNIKGKTVKLLSGADITDPTLAKTLKRLLSKNPFLSAALDALNDWNSWSQNAFTPTDMNITLSEYVKKLWLTLSDNKYVIRRLLFRVYTNNGIDYIQDLNIDGIDEHNLYNGEHSPKQVDDIVKYLMGKYAKNSITTTSGLFSRLTSPAAKSLVNASLKFEQINGTSLKPSFFYLEEYIKPEYELVSFEDAGLPAPIAYYSEFADNLNVQAYDNLKVIRSRTTQKNLAIVKGKFFRQPEFPRRAKEEAYVGLTAKYSLVDNVFSERYPGLPFIMFIDMADNYTPPAFAIRRLAGYGWHPFFQLDKLITYLKELE